MTRTTIPQRWLHRRVTWAALAVVALTACANQNDGSTSGLDIARQALGQLTGRGGSPETAVADTPDAIVARALVANPAPMVLAIMDATPTPQVLAQVGVNGSMRTYMTPGKQALILRDGLLVGTRGLGHDLSVAEPGALAGLIRGRKAGQGLRVMRYLAGDGVERPLPMTCTVATGSAQSVGFAGRNWQGVQVHETCTGQGVTIKNAYLVTSDGQIPVSHQWIGPDLGHVTLQVIRP